jgi:outer membrane protein assembly factor BamB
VIEAAPTLFGDKLLVVTHRATLIAYDIESGNVVWEADPHELERVTARPVAEGDHAYFCNVAGKVFRVKLATGDIDGRWTVGSGISHDPVLRDGVIYVTARKPELIAMRDGKELFRRPLGHTPTTALKYSDGALFVGTSEGAVLVHSARDGHELRRFRRPAVRRSSAA